MKISIFFLLVGLSCCFADDHTDESPGGLELCKGKIKVSEGMVMICMVMNLIKEYRELKNNDKDMSPEKICLIGTTITVVKVASIYKNCSIETITEVVIKCLHLPQETKKMLMLAILEDKPELAANFSADADELTRGLCCAAVQILGVGTGSLALMAATFPMLVPLLGAHVGIVLDIVGSVMGAAFRLVKTISGDYMCQVSDAAGNLLSGGLFDKGFLGISILDGLLQRDLDIDDNVVSVENIVVSPGGGHSTNSPGDGHTTSPGSGSPYS
ncbi:uncharacterized protein RB166_009363 [Leptodactylus fuscus]|uniref:uncharacterized protein LOC142205086 n=1 Tax=Leptodactylus fuscus TaxID=238119 RepID=UPI003F4E58AE